MEVIVQMKPGLKIDSLFLEKQCTLSVKKSFLKTQSVNNWIMDFIFK